MKNKKVTIIIACIVAVIAIVAIISLFSKNKENIEVVSKNDTEETTIDFETVFDNFITVDGTKLMDGNKELKFISLNYPQATSDTPWEQENAVKTIKTMGGNVTRSYTIPVFNGSNAGKAYVIGVDDNGKLTFDEDALVNLDNLLAACNKNGIRLIIPLVDHWHWIGGMDGYVWLAGESSGNKPVSSSFQDWAWKFYSNEKCIDYFKQMITHLLDRTNTVTGVKYKDDPAILCWETANEAGSNQTNQLEHDDVLSAWTIDIVKHIKSIDKNHLVLDGRMSMTEQSMSKENPADILGAHYYEGNYATRCAEDTVAAHNAGKPFILGEFGAKVEAAPCIEVFQAGVDNNTNGIMMWSLRAHKDGYGYYFHDEDGYWAAYHWPGFESGNYYGEREIIRSIYAYAQIVNGNAANYEEARNIPIPAPETDEAPLLYETSFADGSVGDIKWRGVVGGAWYEIQRAEGKVRDQNDPSWETIADESDYVYDSGRNWEDKDHDCIAGYHDQTAEDGKTYSYRLRACNESGEGLWSNIVMVEAVKHVVVDEFDLIAVSSTDPNPTEIRNVYSYDHSANIECTQGAITNNSEQSGYIEYSSEIPVGKVVVTSLGDIKGEYEPKVYGSTDGVIYAQLIVDHESGSNKYIVSDASASGNSYFLRVYLEGNGQCKLDAIELNYKNDGKSYKEKSDASPVEANAMIQDNTFGIDDEPKYVLKSANLDSLSEKGITASDSEEAVLIYKTADDINAYRVVTLEKGGVSPRVEYSYDGVSFVESESLLQEKSGDYSKVTYGNLNISDTVRVVKVTLPAGSKGNVLVKSVELSSGKKSIPLADEAAANSFEDGEFYFGSNKNIVDKYEIKNDSQGIRFTKEFSVMDISAYDCIYAWVKPDGSANSLVLQFTDGNGKIWSAQPLVLNSFATGIQKFRFADFTCDNATEMNLKKIKNFSFVIKGAEEASEAVGTVSLNKDDYYTGNFGVNLTYSINGSTESSVIVDGVCASSSTKADDFESYGGSTNLLRAAYSRNTNGGIFDMTLDESHKSEGAFGLRVDYDYDGTGYAGATKTMDLLNLAGYDGFMMYVDSDGSGNDIKIQIETDISTFSYTGFLKAVGPCVYYMPFSSIKEESWAGTGHELDSTQNLKSVSIYTDLKGDVSSGTFYVDDIKGANYVEALESQASVSMDVKTGDAITAFPYTISGKATYVDYITLSIGEKAFNVPVKSDGTWSYTITEESGIENNPEVEVQAGIYYPNLDAIALAGSNPVIVSVDVK